jgi:7-cyano-7-deazaguanine synthase
MARLASIHAHSLGAQSIYMGVMELEEANSGYRDCSRAYMDIIQAALRMDFADDKFEIRTPLVNMTKKETMELGYKLGVLEYLLENTITCYEGIDKEGCLKCPACKLRNSGLKIFSLEYPEFNFSYKEKILNLIT